MNLSMKSVSLLRSLFVRSYSDRGKCIAVSPNPKIPKTGTIEVRLIPSEFGEVIRFVNFRRCTPEPYVLELTRDEFQVLEYHLPVVKSIVREMRLRNGRNTGMYV